MLFILGFLAKMTNYMKK